MTVHTMRFIFILYLNYLNRNETHQLHERIIN